MNQLDEIRDAVEVLEGHTKGGYVLQPSLQTSKAIEVLLDLAHSYLEVDGAMPEKLICNCKRPDCYAKGGNDVIDRVTLAITRQMLGLEDVINNFWDLNHPSKFNKPSNGTIKQLATAIMSHIVNNKTKGE